MNFFKNLAGAGKGKSHNMTEKELLRAITFDLKDCELKVDKEYELGWLNKDYVGHMLKIHRLLVGSLTYDNHKKQKIITRKNALALTAKCSLPKS